MFHFLLVVIGITLLVPQPLKGQTENPLYFVFRESEFTDSDWAGLATILAEETSPELWQSITVQSGDGLYRIIDRYYGHIRGEPG